MKYILTASDGKVFQSELDKHGHTRIESVAMGEATVVFPELGNAA